MGRLLSAYIFPHPPVLIPEIGGGREAEAQKTINACKKAAQDISEEKPSTIIITTPHAPVFHDFIYMSMTEKLKGSFANFGAPGVSMCFENNLHLARAISGIAAQKGIYAGGLEKEIMKRYDITDELDHGALVPLYFVQKAYAGFKLVHISVSGHPKRCLYEFGMCISDAVKQSNEKVVFIASGDLSHRLSNSGPYGYSPEGPEFDRIVVESLAKMDVEKLMGIAPEFCERAGECGYKSLVMMAGALDGFDAEPDMYSYEGPFAIGYAVGRIKVKGEKPGATVIMENQYVRLARRALEWYVRTGRRIDIPTDIPREMAENRAGVFVSLKKFGRLMGCIGTISPAYRSIAQEIIENAISAGCRDPRFPPVTEEELNSIVYSVDVLGEPEPIQSIEQLDVKRYGVIVRSGMRSGLLLPDLEGVDTPQAQVSIALQKAGISADEDYTLERFEVTRHK